MDMRAECTSPPLAHDAQLLWSSSQQRVPAMQQVSATSFRRGTAQLVARPSFGIATAHSVGSGYRYEYPGYGYRIDSILSFCPSRLPCQSQPGAALVS